MKKLIILSLILIAFLYLTGCGARVPGKVDSGTYKRYIELSETGPENL